MRILFDKKIIFISKPRCGSTSVRRMLDKVSTENDLAVDYAGQHSGLHPHMTVLSICNYLNSRGYDYREFEIFIVTRDPLEMLWSYYNFFKPDTCFKYNYETEYNKNSLVDFESWLVDGHVGLIKLHNPVYQSFISDKDLSPLSLDAHICDHEGKVLVNKIFKVESISEAADWLSLFDFDIGIDFQVTNTSERAVVPKISENIIDSLKKQLPLDFEIYGY